MSIKVERVKAHFDEPDRYILTGRPGIRIRTETVQEFLQDSHFESILDIGCGDGSLSIPLLRPDNRLTLLDLSRNMLSIARSRIPTEFRDSVKTVNEDFTAARLPERDYDLILCVGVLAHVDQPVKVIRKIARLIRPGGSVIVQNADGPHVLSYLWRLNFKIRRLRGNGGYSLNDIPHEAIVSQFQNLGFALAGTYRYAVGIPGLNKFFSQTQVYKGIRAVYGTAKSNRNASLGNEYVYHFRFCGSPQADLTPPSGS